MGNCGCMAAKPVKPTKEMIAKEGNMLDNARSYKSKLGGMRLILRNVTHRRDFIAYLAARQKKRYIEAYEELMKLHAIKELAPLIAEVKKLLVKYPMEGRFIWDRSIVHIGKCLEPIRFSEDEELNVPLIIKNLQWAEESVLAAITPEFEEFIRTQEFTRRGTICLQGNAPLLSTSVSSSARSGKDEGIRLPSNTNEADKVEE